ncbi:HlyD family secretion protein [Beijerinckia indica]|uniref:Secretion protein HlyD family protein n=1 Tax=Beijerinckia indica subsp. indica (strain ATCC 9039 / DSM 1715 / NCIMB 8712) TaxID=395963 RepID=B2IIF5_BEII9|nr:HlyD family secretion protein [Beijerinckia indica]ACB96108.1 secretion protein HlyD family protein [Beijerinckia indica subsp. indica ATCC 9039]
MPIKKPLLLASSGVVILTALAWHMDRLVSGDGIHQMTDDAYVTADFTIVAPKISGRIDQVKVEDNQRVRQGEELAHIEDDDYRTALMAAEAEVTTAKADIANLTAEISRQEAVIAQAKAAVEADAAALDFAKANAQRYHNLSKGGAGTVEQQQAAESEYRQRVAARTRDEAAVVAAEKQIAVLEAQKARAQGARESAESHRYQAELNLSYTTIPAPVDGMVGARGVRVGAYVNPGTALLAVVPLQEAYVLANFQETQLTHVVPGQKALIHVDTFPDTPIHGHVDSIAPATGVAFAPIQPDNATGNFTKVVQRLPVKIVFDPDQDIVRKIRVGMSVEAEIDTASKADGPHANDGRYVLR